MYRSLISIVLLLSLAHATYKPEFEKSPVAVKKWFDAQKLTPAAQLRFQFIECCKNADRFKTKFIATGDGHWLYYSDPLCQREGCKTARIPDDVIHQEGIQALNPKDDNLPEFKQMRAEGVLMIWGDQVTCFWPPQSGI